MWSHRYLLEPTEVVVQDEAGDTEDREMSVMRANASVAWQFCKQHSKSIEIDYENMDGDKILTKVHFQYDPHVSQRNDLPGHSSIILKFDGLFILL